MRQSTQETTSLWALALNLFDQCALSDSWFMPGFDYLDSWRAERELEDTEGEVEDPKFA